MQEPIPSINLLFDQLGLPSSDAEIEAFIGAHRIPDDVKLSEAEFWSDSQRAFLKEQLKADAEWAIPVDELNERLHVKPKIE
nr:DUF2789 domain-containing protein [uncultured Pseudomonas sp.]